MLATLALLVILLAALAYRAAFSRAAQIEDVDWLLASLDGNEPIANTAITARFVRGRVTGSSGCNGYSATYDVRGKTLTIAAVGMTKKFCAQPEGVMQQEQRFGELLGAAQTFQVREDELEILTAAGASLRFVRLR